MNAMKQIATILTYRFFDFDNNVVRIGGIETYTLGELLPVSFAPKTLEV